MALAAPFTSHTYSSLFHTQAQVTPATATVPHHAHAERRTVHSCACIWHPGAFSWVVWGSRRSRVRVRRSGGTDHSYKQDPGVGAAVPLPAPRARGLYVRDSVLFWSHSPLWRRTRSTIGIGHCEVATVRWNQCPLISYSLDKGGCGTMIYVFLPFSFTRACCALSMEKVPVSRAAHFTAHRTRVGRHGRARRCGGSRLNSH